MALVDRSRNFLAGAVRILMKERSLQGPGSSAHPKTSGTLEVISRSRRHRARHRGYETTGAYDGAEDCSDAEYFELDTVEYEEYPDDTAAEKQGGIYFQLDAAEKQGGPEYNQEVDDELQGGTKYFRMHSDNSDTVDRNNGADESHVEHGIDVDEDEQGGLCGRGGEPLAEPEGHCAEAQERCAEAGERCAEAEERCAEAGGPQGRRAALGGASRDAVGGPLTPRLRSRPRTLRRRPSRRWTSWR